MMAMSFLTTGHAADDPADKTSTTELAKLKAQLDEQQKQIEQLSTMLAQQRKLLEQFVASSAPASAPAAAPVATATAAAPAPAAAPLPTTTAAAPAPAPHMLPNLGEVASSTPVLPPPPPAPTPRVLDPQMPQGEPSSPLQLKVGDATLTPVGFMDLTGVWRNENAGSGIGSSFGSVPLANAATAHLSEMRFSPQNSRIGFRFDANVKDAHIIGYNEMDFLGTSGSNAIGVTNGAFVPRVRLYWVDVRKGQIEFLAGQSWSLLTPSRKGISPLPGDIFFSQAMDVNYLAGLTWDRQPGLRLVYHPTDTVAIGFAAENPNQYTGGSSGGSSITAPSAASLSALPGTQFDNASTGAPLSTPNLTPDFIAKAAFDPVSRVHFEFNGIERNFKDWNSATNVKFTKVGAGGSFNANLEVVKNFRIISNNYWSDGGGRYIFGQAPDVIIRSDGSLSPIHSGGFNEGFEANLSKNFLLYSYYGDIYIDKNVALDANGTSLIGYGFRGSSVNRNIQEFTIGYVQTFWKDPKYGALSMITQYEWLNRDLWYVAAGTPKGGHDNTIYVDIRYTLPGSAPTLGK